MNYIKHINYFFTDIKEVITPPASDSSDLRYTRIQSIAMRAIGTLLGITALSLQAVCVFKATPLIVKTAFTNLLHSLLCPIFWFGRIIPIKFLLTTMVAYSIAVIALDCIKIGYNKRESIQNALNHRDSDSDKDCSPNESQNPIGLDEQGIPSYLRDTMIMKSLYQWVKNSKINWCRFLPKALFQR